jgi:DNA-binding NtrC family response regulator
VGGVEGARDLLTREDISACFCGILLADGTYRELVKHEKQGTTEIPIIIVSRPTFPNEYRDNHAAMNIGAFDSQCHPYRRIDLDRIQRASLRSRFRSLRQVGHKRSESDSWDSRPDESRPETSRWRLILTPKGPRQTISAFVVMACLVSLWVQLPLAFRLAAISAG